MPSVHTKREENTQILLASVVVTSSGSAPPESTSIGRAPGCRLYASVRVRPSRDVRAYRTASEGNLSRQALC